MICFYQRKEIFMAKKEVELLSAGKIAAKFEIPAAKVKSIIKELNIEPDQVKGGCSYYSVKSAEKIKKAFGG